MSLMLTIENNSEISCTKGMLLPDWVDLHRAEPWCRVGHASVDAIVLALLLLLRRENGARDLSL